MRIVCLLGAALVLAACGGSNHPGPSTHSTPPVTTVSATSAPATETSTSVTSLGTPLCRASSLALSYLGGQGATGHGELGFALRNTGAVTCHTFGYPGILFLDRAGGALPTLPSRTTHDYFGRVPEVRLTVAPGQMVSFRLGVTHGVTSTAECTTAYGLQVIPPDDTGTLRVAIPDGAYECHTVTVSPLRPGPTAYP